MAKPILLLATVILICYRFHVASTFSVDRLDVARARRQTNDARCIGVESSSSSSSSSSPPTTPHLYDAMESDPIATAIESTSGMVGAIGASFGRSARRALSAGCASSFALIAMMARPLDSFAESIGDELEVAELPPVYVPIIFAIGVIGGVGVLTASLGNVMDEGEEGWRFGVDG